MIAPLLKKDWTLLWPLVVLVTSIQIGLEWADANFGRVDASPAAFELLRPLTVAWFLAITGLVVAVVQQDPIPGVDQDWLIRPLRRGQVLCAKLVFLSLAVSVPMFVLNLGHALLDGFSWKEVVGAIALKELWAFVFLLVPLAALAATTRTLGELMFLGAALVVVYAGCAAASAFVLGGSRCPTCGTGFLWLQHVLQRLELALGAGVILGLQYHRRRTAVSRVLVLLAPVLLVFGQLPWGAAVALQRGVTGSPGAARAVAIAAAPAKVAAAGGGTMPLRLAGTQATRALLRGDLESAVGYLAGRHAALDVEVPLSVSGLSADQLLLVDRTEVRVVDPSHERYRYTLVDPAADSLSPPAGGTDSPGEPIHQSLRVPRNSLEPAGTTVATLRLDYWLTLMQVAEQHRLPALDGIWSSRYLGQCRSHLDEDSVSVACRQIGQGPVCFSATLYGADGAHNAEMRRCLPEYRPYLPSVAFSFSYSGLYLPVRDRSGSAHYPVDWTRLDGAYVLVRLYRPREHFERSLRGISLAE